MPVTLVNTPKSVMEYLKSHYKMDQIVVLRRAMNEYLEQNGQPLLDLFMDPKTRDLGSDISMLLKCMPKENLDRLIDMINDHLQKTADQADQNEKAEYHAEVQARIKHNPEARI